GMNVVNLVLAWTKLVAAVTSIRGEIEVEGSLPLIRTKSSNIDEPGNRVLMKAKFWNEVGRKQMLNCVRLALNASTGLDLSLPTDGPLEEKAVDWHFAGDNEIRVNDAATRNTQNFVYFKSMEVEKQANVMVAITLKSAKDVRQNLIDIAGIAGNMAVGGPMALLLAVPEIGFRLPYTAAHATIPVTDHEPCDGKWKGSITYNLVDSLVIKHN